MDLKEVMMVNDPYNHILYIIRLVGALRYDIIQFILQSVNRVITFQLRGFLKIVLRHETQQFPDKIEPLLLLINGEVCHSGLGSMNAGAAKFINCNILTGNGFCHLWTGDEHIAALAAHDDIVSQCRGIDCTAGAGAEDGRYLRNHS
ncbi:MAG: hypothetical protein BWY89_01586 [Bacteroidetes bacterium ADurb.BinA012]|nr:MAG: hypothetical protein BWY89_01586 [Bacteroidetes bacterium ADurb.BinA012]